jgi:hypothetical protein
MTDLSPELEDLLQRAVAGDLRDDAPELRRASSAHPAFAPRLRALRAAQALLDAAADEERLAMAALASVPDETTTAPEARPAPRGTRSRSSVPRTIATLAAATLVAAIAWWWSRHEPALQFLGGGVTIEALEPDYAAFRFTFRLPAGGWFAVRVVDGERELHQTARTPGPEWRPDPAVRASWPASIRLEVVARDAQGDVQAGGAARVTRAAGR